MPKAVVKAPDGTVLFEAVRDEGRRAVMSCKNAQVATKRIGDELFELVNKYPLGSVIEVDGAVVSAWDGRTWT